MKKIRYILIFLFFLFVSNFYLFNTGMWFYKDASGWAKNIDESYNIFRDTFYIYSNLYYHGFDKGFLGYLSIFLNTTSYLLAMVFGNEIMQIVLIISGYIVIFYSFYFFSRLFIADKENRFLISLFYAFNPLVYGLQGATILYATSPLFIYTFYKFYQQKNNLNYIYLLINILSLFLLFSYVRLFQAFFIPILFYSFYFIISKKIFISSRKLILHLGLFVLVFLPILYSLIFQIAEKSNTAFHYGEFFKSYNHNASIFLAYSPFQSISFEFYKDNIWLITSSIFFVIFLFILIYNKKKTYFIILNLLIILISISLYALPSLFGSDLYSKLLIIFPFITNGAIWALYSGSLAFTLIIGILLKHNLVYLRLFVYIFIGLSLIPFINYGDKQFKKVRFEEIPISYRNYFIDNYVNFPEATFYFPAMCWRALYMDTLEIPTICLNHGYGFRPINLDNPRLLTGEDYYLSSFLKNNFDIYNLRVTHNLKNIIVAKDLMEKNNTQLNPDDKRLAELKLSSNEQFNHFYFPDKDKYDFFIYAPKRVINKEKIEDINDNSLEIDQLPVAIVGGRLFAGDYQAVNLEYKADKYNPTKYYLKINNIDNKKPFLVQMNQSYNKNWKFYWINEDQYNSIKCTNINKYLLTNNQKCAYTDSVVNFNDLFILKNPRVEDAAHFRGNFIGNGWLINPDSIPQSEKSSKELYAIIFYEKQAGYSFAIIISLTTIIILILCFLLNLFNKRKLSS